MLQILGGFVLKNSRGQGLKIRGRKTQALLSRLALAARPLSREHLAALLWGEMPDDRARHNLRQAVSELRRVVGEDALRKDADAIELDPSEIETDAVQFAEVAESQEMDVMARAVSLYRGELLAGLDVKEDAFEDWLRGERSRLRRLACELSAALTLRAFAAGDDQRGFEAARARLALDPTCEQTHRALMQAHARRGERSEVRRQFDACKDALQRHVGTSPHPDTLRLFEQLKASPNSTANNAPPPHTHAPLALPDRPSIAVLPFENLSGDAEQSYFSDGITEDIIVALCRFSSLFVIARSSSFAYRGAEHDARRVGRELGVHFVATGSVRRQGSRVRISVQLTDAGTGEAIWAERYDREMSDIFAMQDEVANTVVATVVGRVESAHLARTRDVPALRLAAYDCLLRGKEHHHRYSAQDNALAQQWLTRAIEVDPSLAAAHAWMACVLAQSNSFTPDPSVFDRAYEYVMRAHALDDGESECHRILAAYYLIRRRHDDAERHQRRAMQLNPNDDRIVCQEGELLVFLGRAQEAVEWIERAMRLNPHHTDNYWYEYGRALYGAGRNSEAIAALRHIGAPRPPHLAFLAACCTRTGDQRGAETALERLLEQRAHATATALVRGLPYRDQADADQLVADLRAAGLR